MQRVQGLPHFASPCQDGVWGDEIGAAALSGGFAFFMVGVSRERIRLVFLDDIETLQGKRHMGIHAMAAGIMHW